MTERVHDHPAAHQRSHAHGGHGSMMLACCIPVLAIAAVLVAAGIVGVGFLVFAVVCTALMALMMRGMSDGESDRGHQYG